MALGDPHWPMAGEGGHREPGRRDEPRVLRGLWGVGFAVELLSQPRGRMGDRRA